MLRDTDIHADPDSVPVTCREPRAPGPKPKPPPKHRPKPKRGDPVESGDGRRGIRGSDYDRFVAAGLAAGLCAQDDPRADRYGRPVWITRMSYAASGASSLAGFEAFKDD